MSGGVVSALECFSEARGLDRSLEIAADLNNLDHQGPDALDSSYDSPSPKAAEYAEYIGTIGHDCVEAASGEARANACLRSANGVFDACVDKCLTLSSAAK